MVGGGGNSMRDFIFAAQPVASPGLAALAIGGLCFFAAVVKTRLGAGGSGAGAKSSPLSAIGIALQMAGFFATGFGPVKVALAPASAVGLAEAFAVAALLASAVLLFAAAAGSMGANWSLIARTRADHELVTKGVFARVRNPIYLAMALFLLALAIGLGHEANLLAGAPCFALGTWIRVREEEKLLRAQFGAGYDDYAARVKRFVPGVF
jgi:protein-S-isoprenylcysteine O-methyltransferase Ste14